ncbi:hypothetical protein AGLY_015589 [Aphis glycines]|uniref:Uncharacterized protein n=1 Tax=Aphis glycines TaxID=307491 RepID=A0A6G0T0A8_APHGL|nr:hypothetical protein AGLY_015589 [Aphis glycines]
MCGITPELLTRYLIETWWRSLNKIGTFDAFLRDMAQTRTMTNAGKWVPFCCTLGGGVDLGLGITYEELCIKFSSILIGPKKFYRHFKKKIFRKIENFTTIKTTHQEPCIKFSKLFGHPKIFYRHFKKNFSKKSKISVIPLTLTFGENFNSAALRHTKKKTHIIVKSIHSSLRSESNKSCKNGRVQSNGRAHSAVVMSSAERIQQDSQKMRNFYRQGLKKFHSNSKTLFVDEGYRTFTLCKYRNIVLIKYQSYLYENSHFIHNVVTIEISNTVLIVTCLILDVGTKSNLLIKKFQKIGGKNTIH